MDTAQAGTYGRVRQRIVAMGRVARKGTSAQSLARAVAADRYVRAVVRSGRIRQEQLQRAVEGYHASPSTFVWLIEMDPAVLDRAECAFLAEYGRFPVAEGDFQINGVYHRICRSLLYDWHYYDDQLMKLTYDQAGRPYAPLPDGVQLRQDIQTRQTTKGGLWTFGFVLTTGLIGGLALGAAILQRATLDPVSVVWVFGVPWILGFGALLAATIPRRISSRTIIFRCGRCNRALESQQAMIGCPACGALFRK